MEKDIFDKIMSIPVLNICEPFYTKYKSVLLYLFFGGLAFLLSIVIFAVLNQFLNEHAANVISWIIVVFFAFTTNRVWVFRSEATIGLEIFRETVSFFAGRLVTLAFEEIIIFVFITKLHFNSIAVKIVAQVVVIVLNYLISKLIVFRKKKEPEQK